MRGFWALTAVIIVSSLRWRPSRLAVCLGFILVCLAGHSELQAATQPEIDALKKELSLLKISPVTPPPTPSPNDGKHHAVRIFNLAAHSLNELINGKPDLSAIATADLLTCLDDKKPAVRANCVYALSQMNYSIQSSDAPKIIRLLHDSDKVIAYWSLEALRHVDLDSKTTPQMIGISERDGDPHIRERVFDYLKGGSSVSCQYFYEPLKSPKRTAKIRAAQWIAKLECDAANELPDLEKMGTDNDAEVATAAQKAIESIKKVEENSGDGDP